MYNLSFLLMFAVNIGPFYCVHHSLVFVHTNGSQRIVKSAVTARYYDVFRK